MRQSTWFHRHSSISQASGYGCACELSASSSGTQPESAHLNDPRPISESPPRHHAALGTLPCSVPRERHPPHWHHRLGQDVSRIRIALQSTPPPGPFRFPASHLGAEAFLQSGTAPAPRPLRTRSGTGAGTALCFRSWSSQESRGFADTHCCSDSRPGSCTLYGHTIGAPASYSNNIIKYYGLIHY